MDILDLATPALECPTCGYDLRGLVDAETATCPQCGKSHSVDQLFMPPARVRSGPVGWLIAIGEWGKESLPWWFLAACAGLVWLALTSGPGPRRGPFEFILWPPVLVGAWTAKMYLRWALAPSLVVAVLMCTLAFGIRDNRREIHIAVVLAANALPMGLWCAIWLLPPRPSRPGALLLGALVPGVPGAAMFGAGIRKYMIGEYWTAWSDPRTGYYYDQWPLDRADALLYGTLLLVPAAVLVVTAVVLWLDRSGRPGRS